jgi:hypothetical protein
MFPISTFNHIFTYNTNNSTTNPLIQISKLMNMGLIGHAYRIFCTVKSFIRIYMV